MSAKRRVFTLDLFSAPHPVESLVLSHKGEKLTDDEVRREMIEASVAGAHIELLAEGLVAYAQAPGVQNRKFVRFRDGSLTRLARSGKGVPFLRNHGQGREQDRGGTVVASRLVRSDGFAQISQDVSIKVPWAVQLALRGMLDRFSIGWNPLGELHCTLCKAPYRECIWSKGHFPGSEHDGEIVEFEYQAAELIETSYVNVNAVREVGPGTVRRTLSVRVPDSVDVPDLPETLQITTGQEPNKMPLREINTRLGLVAEADAPSALSAIGRLESERDDWKVRAEGFEAQLADVTAERDKLSGELAEVTASREKLSAELAQTAADAFVAEALESGRCAKGSETEKWLRALYADNPAVAREQLAALGRVTPVGAPRQSGSATAVKSIDAPDYEKLAATLSARDRKIVARARVSAAAYVEANYDELRGDYGWPARAAQQEEVR